MSIGSTKDYPIGVLKWQNLFLGDEPQGLKCIASDASELGDFKWMVGTEVLPMQGVKKKISDRTFSHTYDLKAEIDYHDQPLKCL